jgi:ACT domain-containing protein
MTDTLYFMTITGVDRIGIVARVSSAIFRHGGNIVDSYQRIMGKHFIIGLLVDMGPLDTSIAGLLQDFAEIERDWGLRILMQQGDRFLATPQNASGSEAPGSSPEKRS